MKQNKHLKYQNFENSNIIKKNKHVNLDRIRFEWKRKNTRLLGNFINEYLNIKINFIK